LAIPSGQYWPFWPTIGHRRRAAVAVEKGLGAQLLDGPTLASWLAWSMHRSRLPVTDKTKEIGMKQWTTPKAHDLRLGFEITMYVNNR
jgi:coenzyme PQQ precursor peptide PqqA